MLNNKINKRMLILAAVIFCAMYIHNINVWNQ